MSGLFVRCDTAGLDEVREAGGLIKGARLERVAGFCLSCFGIASRRFIVKVGTLHLSAWAGQIVEAGLLLMRWSWSPLSLACGSYPP